MQPAYLKSLILRQIGKIYKSQINETTWYQIHDELAVPIGDRLNEWVINIEWQLDETSQI